MVRPRSRFGWFVVGLAVSTILCFIGLLVLNLVLGGLYGFDLLATPIVSEWLCYAILVPLALGLIGLVYQNTFIRSTYTDKERRALQKQLLALASSVLFIVLGFILGRPLLLFGASLMLGFVGLNSIINRVAVITHHPLLVEAHNRGWSAILTGLVEIVVALLILVMAIDLIG